ncbi:MAG: SDR family oxidoreductase [Bacteroidia bacterium]|nr:SDR family oxidoreductase [Bacteroidia bacterium]
MKDKVVLITGGSSGIGKALAERFAKAGAKIVITGRNKENLDLVVEELRKSGTQISGVAGDVSVYEDCERMINRAVKVYGGIDILINNAGMSMRALFEDLDVVVIEKLMQINFYGTVYCTKLALPHILKSKGSIIGISSVAGWRGLPGRTGYTASKFAMNGFLEALRTELLYKGVHIMAVAPGFTSSNIRNTAFVADGSQQGESPLDEGKIMSAEECADMIFKATVKRKRTLIADRQGKMTIFFNKWLPGWLDKKVFDHFAREANSPLKK